MNSGIEFIEDYTQASDVTRMLYQEYDMVEYYDSLPKTRPPGQKWYYSSGKSLRM
jgi:CubicO group peptidase (beta-lactamase class C family)